MNGRRDLLIEIGSEELPPKALQQLSQSFVAGIRDGLQHAELAFAAIEGFATPRRLAVLVQQLETAQADREQLRRGPALAAAFDDEGCATRAAEGFARSCGVSVEQLEKIESEKGAWLGYRVRETGHPTTTLVPEIVRNALDRLPIPKRMRWGDGDTEFVRPVHWVVLLFGDEVIEAEILGLSAGRETRGHRFLHPAPIYLAQPDAYAPVLETEGHVLVDIPARRAAIRGQVIEIARAGGGEALINEALLDEVTALVEWPVAMPGSFEQAFLEIPQEALISSMQDHQKYFPVVDKQGRLLPQFVTVANIESRDAAQVRAGNERVIRPRLADAAFFWEQDRKRRLETRADQLRNMIFQKRLGTLFDKQQRVAQLAARLAAALGSDPMLADRAAALAKCDLVTSMVYEFPELQGIMGRYYALHDGEPEEVAMALAEQYRPHFAGDELPATRTGQALAIADRLDTLVGIFAIGQAPTGDRDPFALRRAALGVLRILIEGQLDLNLMLFLKQAATHFSPEIKADHAVDAVFEFMMDRLRAYYTDRDVPVNIFEAVRARQPVRPLDFDRRIRAVNEFQRLPEAQALAAANKRIGNILRKTEDRLPATFDAARLVEPAEQQLAARLAELTPRVSALFDESEYTAALRELATLREPVDGFFDAVMVMADDLDLRRNRLALLQHLHTLFLRAADLSRLQA